MPRHFSILLTVALLSAACSTGSESTTDLVTTSASSLAAPGAAGSRSSPTLASSAADGSTVDSSVVESSAVDSSTDTGSASSATTTGTSAGTVASDAEPGLLHDVGQIIELSEDAAGTTYLTFDRYQGYDDAGQLVSAPNLPAEFIYEPTTDFPFVNENPALRRYPVAPDVEVVQTDPAWFAGQDEVCGGDGSYVIRIRFMPGC